MNKKTKIGLILGIFFGFVLGGIWFVENYSSAAVSTKTPVSSATFLFYDFFSTTTIPSLVTSVVATTTSATSTNITSYFDTNGTKENGYLNIHGAKKVQVYFKRGDTTGQGNTGTSQFKLQVSPDGSTWYDFSKLVSATSSANDLSANYTASTTISAASSTITYALDLSRNSFKALRCIVVEFSDGEHSCWATVEY